MRKNKKKGFTLIEIMVAIGIAAVLTATIAPSLSSSSTSAKEKADVAVIKTLETEIVAGTQEPKVYKDAKMIASQTTENEIDLIYGINAMAIS